MKKLYLLTAFCCASLAFGQDSGSFVKPGPIGQPAAKPSSDCTFTARNAPPITCWVGEQVIFLPTFKETQRFGYQSFKGGKGEFGSPAYDEAVGRIGTITAVRPAQFFGFDIDVKMDDNAQLYTGSTTDRDANSASVRGVALLRELKDARAALKGKTVWLTAGQIGIYDDSVGALAPGVKTDIKTKRFQPVVIEDVVAGWYNETPVRLIVKTADGQEGYADLAYSGVNAGALRGLDNMESVISLTDPRLAHPWPAAIWSAFENDSVTVGMTPEQVTFLWGKPESINRTTTQSGTSDQWVYKQYGTVYFTNGAVTAVQN